MNVFFCPNQWLFSARLSFSQILLSFHWKATKSFPEMSRPIKLMYCVGGLEAASFLGREVGGLQLKDLRPTIWPVVLTQ